MRTTRRPRRFIAALVAGALGAGVLASLAFAAPADRHAPAVERWRPLVEKHWAQHGYADEVEFALMVMYAESQGVPTALNPTSDASGLFQHLPKFWADRSARAGWAGADIFDPEANIAVAAWLRATNHERGWYHWAPVWDRTPIGSFGPETHWDAARGWYAAMGGGELGTQRAFTAAPRAALKMSKSAGDADARGVLQGTPFTWTFAITNTGNATATGVVVRDAVLGMVTCPADTLEPASTMICTAPAIAGAGPGGGSSTVTAAGGTVSASASGMYQGIPDTGLELRTASLPHTTVLRFKNTGSVDLWALGVWIDEKGTHTCPVRGLRPGDIVTCDTPAGAVIGDAWAFTDTGIRVAATRR